MDPVRSSLGGGVAATAVLLCSLLALDVLLADADVLVFTTFTGLCAVTGPPFCPATGATSTVLIAAWFVLLYVFAWPLLFAGFTWGLPGESGVVHGLLYGLILWSGFLFVILNEIGFGARSVSVGLVLLLATLVVYLTYGVVLGAVYDHLAAHRTLLD